MVTITQVDVNSPLYEAERELRNKVLLRPIGLPDHAWEIHDGKAWHFIAEEEGRVIGCVLLVPLGSTGKDAQLLQMAVDSSYQGKGIGKMLMAELLNFCAANGIQNIICHARASAVKFYLKLGFQTLFDPFLEVGIPHFYMRLTFPAEATSNP